MRYKIEVGIHICYRLTNDDNYDDDDDALWARIEKTQNK